MADDFKVVLRKDGKEYTASIDWLSMQVTSKLEDRLKVIQESIKVLRDAFHEQLVQFFQKRIVGILEISGKAWRYGDLMSTLGPDLFWMQKHEALMNLEESGRVIGNRGWIKLAEKTEVSEG